MVVSKYVPSAPCYDGECCKSQRNCRNKERKYRKDGCNENRNAWVEAAKIENKLFSDKRNFYWNGLVKVNESNPKKLCGVLNNILCRDATDNSSGMVKDWFDSYLIDRTQRVFFKNMRSCNEPVFAGVPRSSVLGPILFLLYTADIFKVIDNF